MAAATKTIVRYVKPKVKRRRGKGRLSLAVLAGFLPMGIDVIEQLKAGSMAGAGHVVVANLTGYQMWDRKWSFQTLVKGMAPIALGVVVHKVASRLGLNRMIGKAKIPFIGV